jgi:LysR family cyn operon transcriptional activator
MPARYSSRVVDLRHLQYFVAVARALNISRAARSLRISQPALSRQLRDLECELGLVLLERGRTLRLTGAGHDLLEHGQKVLSQVDAFQQRAQSLQGGDVGVLRVGATPQTLERLFPSVLARYCRALPRVDVQLVEATPAAIVDLLRTGELHLGLRLHQPERAFCSRLIGVLPLLAVRRAAGRRGATLELRELRGERLLLLARGFGTRALFDAACHVAGFHPNVYLESAAAPTLLAFARSGLGVAIIPRSVPFRAHGLGVQRLQLDGTPLEARVAIEWNPERFLPAYAQRFVDELAAQARDAYASSAG